MSTHIGVWLMSKDDTNTSYYLEDVYGHHMPNLIPKVENGTLSQEEIDEIRECWKESMACGALCYYKWFKEDPEHDSTKEQMNIIPKKTSSIR